MNHIKIKILFTLLLLFGCRSSYSQNKTNIKQNAIFSAAPTFKETLEKKIASLGEPYISWLNQTTDSIPQNFATQITNLKWPLEESSKNHQPAISKEEHYKAAFRALRQLKSTSIDPIWNVIANNPVNTICGDGDFEADSLNTSAVEWSGAWGNLTTPINDPSFGVYTAGYLPASSGINLPINSFSNCSNGLASDQSFQNHHSIVSAANDPMVGSLLHTAANSSSNYAFRIGNSCNGYGAEILSKKFVVSGNGIIKFSYALVMNGIHDSTANPSFWVKIYDSAGNLLPGKVYLDPSSSPVDHVISSPTDPFFQHFNDTINFTGVINYKGWLCAKIDLSQNIGQTVSVALITTDCSAGGHWGYGYIDNWCGDCAGSATGTVDVTIPDSCIAEGAQINVDYTLPVIGPDTGTVSLTLTFYHNGVATGYTLVSPVLTTNGTYSFTAVADSLPCNGTGYDVVAQANFAVGPALNPTFYSITSPDPFSSSGIKPGLNNDLVCCPTLAEICDSTDANLSGTPGGCCYQVLISNKFSNSYFTGISITSDNLSIATISSTNSWSTISYQTPNQVIFSKIGSSSGIPLDTGSFQTLGSICFSGSVPANITIRFIGPAPLFDTLCPKIIPIMGCAQPVDTSCVGMDTLAAECNAGVIKMKFRIKNHSAFTMRGLHLYSQNPDVVFSPMFVSIPDLLPGQTSSFIQTTLFVSNNASSVCFFVSACDQNTPPGQDGNYPNFCCMDSIKYCVQLPACSPCDGINITTAKQDSVNCCYNLTLATNYSNANIGTLEFTGLNGTQFAVFTGSGWSIIAPVGSGHIKIKAFGSGVPPGTYPNFASFCLTGSSSAPHKVAVNIMDVNGVLLCRDTLLFDSCQLVQPSCANLVNDSLYCSGNKVQYSFYIKNNAPFPLYQVDFRTTDSSVVLDRPYMQIIPPIASGSTGGPYTVTIDSADANLSQFCMYLTGHNGIYDSIHGLAATECCTDSLGGICLPMIKCGDTTATCDTTLIHTDTTICCCQLGSVLVPNGITPNGDGKNDLFEIKNPNCCEYISIEIYNRWGNMIFNDLNYQNNWDGVNQSGQKLPQGTYFVVIKLPDGSKQTTYLDIRY